MRHPALRPPSPAMVVAVVALFMALGGTGYAAREIARSPARTSAHTRSHACIAARLCSRLKRAVDTEIASFVATHKRRLRGPAGAPGAQGPQGPQGAQGAQGTQGPAGVQGPSDAYTAKGSPPLTLSNLPAGSYVISAKAYAFTLASSAGPFATTCTLTAESDSDDSAATLPSAPSSGPVDYSEATLANQLTHTFTSTGSVTYGCRENTGNIGFYQGRVTAIRVGALH